MTGRLVVYLVRDCYEIRAAADPWIGGSQLIRV